MSVSDLIRLLPPPAVPVENEVSIPWDSVDSKLGLQLPDDYKEFIQTYGGVAINDFVHAFNPFTPNVHLNLFVKSDQILKGLRSLQADEHFDLPFPVFPEEGGVFPWGLTDNGDALLWTVHHRRTFGVVVYASDGGNSQSFDASLTEFIADIVSAKTTTSIFPTGFPRGSPFIVQTSSPRKPDA